MCGVLLLILAGVVACGAGGPQGAMSAPAKPAATVPPVLTTEERLSLENARLKVTLVQIQLQQLVAELQRQAAAIEAAHPGWSVNLDTLALVKVEPTKKDGR
jgi:hypothetical protein